MSNYIPGAVDALYGEKCGAAPIYIIHYLKKIVFVYAKTIFNLTDS